jgi:hypothetical protein
LLRHIGSRLGVRIGEDCARLHDRMMRDLNVAVIECDEQWDYIAKKQKRVREGSRQSLTMSGCTSRSPQRTRP